MMLALRLAFAHRPLYPRKKQQNGCLTTAKLPSRIKPLLIIGKGHIIITTRARETRLKFQRCKSRSAMSEVTSV
ncbi:hypothetical protein QQF64_023087 [Cirrhinus molitorella]|uniref:Uncharacterized protein n=2 Tax=Cirrhinus molitorella TaxID=172907 RepID=A0ABR3L6H4_9TELE|nr:hypothetical protein Q8A67_025520 [Cirrhinus molitorella]